MPPNNNTKPPSFEEIEQALKEAKEAKMKSGAFAQPNAQASQPVAGVVPPTPTPQPAPPTPIIPPTPATPIRTDDLQIADLVQEFEQEASLEEIPKQMARETSDVPKMVSLVVRLSGGAIKDKRQAEYFLFGVVVVVMIVSAFLFFGVGRKSPFDGVSPPEREQLRQLNR
jgi:hypothetical protein